MKRATHLKEPILELANLRLAYWKAARGKRNQAEVRQFGTNLEQHIQEIRRQLLAGSFCIGNFRSFTIYEPKERIIHAAAFSERVVHHAIFNICEPIFNRMLIYDTYACRKGKGRLVALDRAQKFSRRYPWFLKMDIRKYFDSIDHSILLGQLHRHFKDSWLLDLFERIIGSYETQRGKGLPIGSLTSQHFANFYLSGLDRFVKETLGYRAYVRYMDDFVIWGVDKKSLKETLQAVSTFLETRLALLFRDFPYINKTGRGLNFLGFRLYPNRQRLTHQGRQRFIRKWRQYETLFTQEEISERELQQRMTALLSFVKKADSLGFRQKLFYESVSL